MGIACGGSEGSAAEALAAACWHGHESSPEEDSSFSGPFPCAPKLFSSLVSWEVLLLPGAAAVPKAAGTRDIFGDTRGIVCTGCS